MKAQMAIRVEDNENVTYSYSSNSGEGKSLTQPQEIPSHGSPIIHTTHSEILGGGEEKEKED